jgi:dTDP-4-dehydrorhamnose 3,5-epimerase
MNMKERKNMSDRFEVFDMPIPGLKLIQRKPFGDNRGYFERFFCQNELKELLGDKTILQINHSRSNKAGTIRGLHFQYPPYAEKKWVSCLKGEIFDVAVDIRRGSSTFLHWHGEILSEDNHRTLLLPEGFAHGFQSLSDNSEILYLCTAAYQPSAEAALNVLDPRLAIHWPLPISEQSARDKEQCIIVPSFQGVTI